MDGVSAIGDLSPVFNNAGGFAAEPALTIGNDVMSELISVRFPWKWNRLTIAGFPLTSYQQDYASEITNIGWLESGRRVDINNTQFPPPSYPLEVVRDLAASNSMGGFPEQCCWFYNRDLEQGIWPGAGLIYTNPIGANTAPSNKATNILDSQGNILVLITYGTTGDTPPEAPAWNDPALDEPEDWPVGQIIDDGTCQWKVVSPDAQGFRFNPRPPESGQVWLIRLIGQKRAVPFLKMQQKCNPIPDDEIKWFRDGCVAYSHRYSTNQQVKNRYPSMKAEWLAAVAEQARQNDREAESKGFYPTQALMSPGPCNDPGPYPYRYGWRR